MHIIFHSIILTVVSAGSGTAKVERGDKKKLPKTWKLASGSFVVLRVCTLHFQHKTMQESTLQGSHTWHIGLASRLYLYSSIEVFPIWKWIKKCTAKNNSKMNKTVITFQYDISIWGIMCLNFPLTL